MTASDPSVTPATRPPRRTSPLANYLSRLTIWLIILAITALGAALLWQAFRLIASGNQDDLFGANYLTLEAQVITIALLILLLLVILFPAFQVISYTVIQTKTILAQTAENLALCGVGVDGSANELTAQVQRFARRNSFTAFFFPLLLLTIALTIGWGIVVMPRGLSGVVTSLSQGEVLSGTPDSIVVFYNPQSGRGAEVQTCPEGGFCIETQLAYTNGAVVRGFDAAALFRFLVDHSSALTWTFLGAYFYIILSLSQRWLRSDLTTGFLWRSNLRLLVAIIIGLLLTLLGSRSQAGDATGLPAGTFVLAFFAGLIPDIALNWIAGRAQALLNLQGRSSTSDWLHGLFQPPELQRRLEGMSFWQADRLMEEGVESVRNLAMQAIPDLLVHTRFDTTRLIDWIDQALLISQAGSVVPIDAFRAVGIKTASDLMDVWQEGPEAQTTLVNALNAVAEDRAGAPLTRASVHNIVVGLGTGANLAYVRTYWANMEPARRAATLRQLRPAVG